MKDIILIPFISAALLSAEIEEELEEWDIRTHDQDHIVGVSWDGDNEFPLLKEWLVQNYGDSVKAYTEFALYGS